MIKRFGFKNYASFKDGAEISFEVPNSHISSVIGIKGANGSGKTNILKALSFLYCFCNRKMNTTIEDANGVNIVDIPVDRHFRSSEPAEFYIELLINKTTYYYELDVREDGIIREELRRKKPTKEVVCIIRELDKITHHLKEFEELTKIKLKSDKSIISSISDYEFHNCMPDLAAVSDAFKQVIFNVGSNGYRNTYEIDDYFKASKIYNADKEALAFTNFIIKKIDSGISNISIEKTTDKVTGDTIYFPIFYHKKGKEQHPISLDKESMGTKSLFVHLFRYWLTLATGGLLILDEFDTHLHAMVLPELIELFTNKTTNKRNAQLIVTAHNTEIIDSLGRYQTILVNKENNESYCYRLDDVSMLRNDRDISPIYKKGKIGGTPDGIKGMADELAEHLEIYKHV